MRILTYNLWHGLDGSGRLFFGELEPRGRRLQRAQVQVRGLRQCKADLLMLQELNPLYPGVFYYSSELGLEHIEQLDLSGIKLFGFGPPFNLQSGLAILTHSNWGLRSIKGIQLSGSGPKSRGSCSLQLHESRYALAGEFHHPEWGRVLAINLHLHHGVGFEPSWMGLLRNWVEKKVISRQMKQEIEEDLSRGERRRLSEIHRVLDFVREKHSHYDLVILGGDFNSGPETRVTKEIREMGFVDAWAKAHPQEMGYTWDSDHNQENHVYNEAFKSIYQMKVKQVPKEVAGSLMKKVREEEAKPRRIDFLFYRTSHSHQVRADLFVCQDPVTQMIGSDHFGVSLELTRN